MDEVDTRITAMYAWIWLSLITLLSSVAASSVLFGFKTKDAAYLSATSAVENGGGVVMQDNVEWITAIGDRMIVGIIGDSSDVDFLRRQLEAANEEHKLTFHGESLRCEAMAYYGSGIIAKYLRSPNPLNAECIVAGCGTNGEPLLFWLDSIGSIKKVEYGAFGKDSGMVLSTLDRCNREKKFAQMIGYEDAASESRMVIDSLLGSPSKGDTRYDTDDKERSGFPCNVMKACWSAIRARSSTLAPPGSCQVKAVSATWGVLSFDPV